MADPVAPAKPKTKPVVKKQLIMRRVLLSLLPTLLGAIYLFGWRALAMVVWVCLWCVGTEYWLARQRQDPLTEASLVTGTLLALSLPPTVPFWMAAVGAVVGISFGKELFGGFGRNVFNPAIVGRAFLYVCFPIVMTAGFTPVWNQSWWRGLVHWGPQRLYAGIDAVSAATPMWVRRDYAIVTELPQLFSGLLGGTFTTADTTQVLAAGSMGEVSVWLIAIGAVYLLWTKTANWRLTVGCLAGALAAVLLFRYGLGATAVPPPLWSMSSGALLYAAVFMVTDPVSAPNDRRAQWIYAVFIGVMIIFFRWRAVFAGGVAFAILLGNTIGPSVEIWSKALAQRKKASTAKAT